MTEGLLLIGVLTARWRNRAAGLRPSSPMRHPCGRVRPSMQANARLSAPMGRRANPGERHSSTCQRTIEEGHSVVLTRPSADPAGFVHAVGFYASEDAFVRSFAPFLQDGVRRGCPTMVRLVKRKADILRMALDDPAGVLFVDLEDERDHLGSALAPSLAFVERHAVDPDRPLRILGEIPPLDGLALDVWDRYEAAFNHHAGHLPVKAVCVCDERLTSEDSRRRLLRHHHAVVGGDGRHHANASFVPPAEFFDSREEPARDPLEERVPDVDQSDPSPLAARRVAQGLARGARLNSSEADCLLHAVTEMVTNALLHGRRPVRLRAWSATGRVVVAICDAGEGPRDPFAGLLQSEQLEREGGRGLWITHQLCPETTLSVSEDGFTVRVAVGTPQD